MSSATDKVDRADLDDQHSRRPPKCPNCGADWRSPKAPWLSRSGYICPNCSVNGNPQGTLYHSCIDGVVRVLKSGEQCFNCSECQRIRAMKPKPVSPTYQYDPNVL